MVWRMKGMRKVKWPIYTHTYCTEDDNCIYLYFIE